MTFNHRLLADLLRENPFQPATDLWRAVEVNEVMARGLPTGRGLDVACGDGRLLRVLLDNLGVEREIVGIDLDPREIEAAAVSGAYVSTHVASADAIPEPDASFDWAFSNSALEHIEPITGTLAEVGRLLRPGAPFIFTVPSAGFDACLRGPLYGDRAAYERMIDRRCAHLRFWDEPTWRRSLAAAGLELETMDFYLTRSQVRRWELVSGLTAGVLYRLMRRHPLEMQHALGMRRGQRLPDLLARIFGRLLTLGLRNDSAGPFGCAYLVARRPLT